MPFQIHSPIKIIRVAQLCVVGCLVMGLAWTGRAETPNEGVSLVRIQRVLPAQTKLLVTATTKGVIESALQELLVPEQDPAVLISRIEEVLKERAGFEIFNIEGVAFFRCRKGEQGLVLVGDFDARGLRNTDLRVGGLKAISLDPITVHSRLVAPQIHRHWHRHSLHCKSLSANSAAQRPGWRRTCHH